jgi:hypothetical protein
MPDLVQPGLHVGSSTTCSPIWLFILNPSDFGLAINLTFVAALNSYLKKMNVKIS